MSYKTQSEDIVESVDRAMFARFAQMTPQERLRLAMNAVRDAERLSIAGLRLRHPDASEDELRRRAGALRLGPELTRWAFGDQAEAWLD